MRIILTAAILLMMSCSSGITEADYKNIVDELNACKATVEELENTPDKRLNKGLELLQKGQEDEGIQVLNELISKFPASEEASKANQEIATIEERKEKELKEEERRKRLGFKVLKESTRFKVVDVELSLSSIKVSKNWIFDRYEKRYFTIEAQRGEKYITSTASIKSTVNNPKLPKISAYRVNGDKLTFIRDMNYRFYRWRDYGAYLGNYADYKNDFSRTETIRFSIGLAINEDYLKEDVIVLLASKSTCIQRKQSRGNPPISYDPVGCKYRQNLTVKEAQEDFVTVKIFNKDKF